jgi:hypothetical protein
LARRLAEEAAERERFVDGPMLHSILSILVRWSAPVKPSVDVAKRRKRRSGSVAEMRKRLNDDVVRKKSDSGDRRWKTCFAESVIALIMLHALLTCNLRARET